MQSPLRRKLFALLLCPLLLSVGAFAHVGEHPSVHDTVARIIERLRLKLTPVQLIYLSNNQIERQLTPAERHILGTEHITFRVNVPVSVYIARWVAPKQDPFWLKERDFVPVPITWTNKSDKLKTFKRDFPAGEVGLGVNSLVGGGSHYLVFLAPLNPTNTLTLSDVYPGQLRSTLLTNGVNPYVDEFERLHTIPPQFVGYTLLQTRDDSREDARIREVFRWTGHPALSNPDQIILTWVDDPRTTQTIQWRTSDRVRKGYVRYAKKSDINPPSTNSPRPLELTAKTEPLVTKFIVNDPINRHHTVTVSNLEPATTYMYAVGDGTARNWSPPAEFTTAPAGPAPFSFVYMGDAQNGLYRWGTLLKNAHRARPDAAFYIMAGDLINRGADRDDWDDLLYNSQGVYNYRPLVPCIGNHECQAGRPELYLRLFDLPKNGPPKIEKKRAYSFEYSNALFIVLDSNLEPDTQSEWLEHQLASTKAKWKFVVYHHPAYSSAAHRDNPDIRHLWGAIFDKYHVDLALQGHDHSYLRTYPMKGEKRVGSAAQGTIYIVSVSGTKMYEQDKRDYTEFGMTNVATYQILDIEINGNRLTYRAHDIDGKVRDQLIIEKP
jgi:acid phosphatase type 7